MIEIFVEVSVGVVAFVLGVITASSRSEAAAIGWAVLAGVIVFLNAVFS